MTAPPGLLQLSDHLPEEMRRETILAWRFCPPVWQWLSQSGKIDQLESPELSWPLDFTPAALGLAAIGMRFHLPGLLSDPWQPASPELEAAAAPHHPTGDDSFASPGLLGVTAQALLLRAACLKEDGWGPALERLTALSVDDAGCVLACLSGMVPNAADLLLAAAAAGHVIEALQALLCNPMPSEERLIQVTALLRAADPGKIESGLRWLGERRPAFALELAEKVLPVMPEEQAGQPLSALDFPMLLESVDKGSRQADRLALTSATESSIQQLTQALNATKYIQAHLYTRVAQLSESLARLDQPGASYPAIALEAWKRANQLARDVPGYACSFTFALLDSERDTEAQIFYKEARLEERHPTHPGVALAGACLAWLDGDHQAALLYAIRALASYQDHPELSKVGRPQELSRLARLLLELDNPAAASQAAQMALSLHPADQPLLILAAQAALGAKEPAPALEAAYLAWVLQPDDPRAERLYRTSLEAGSLWQAAYRRYRALVPDLEQADNELLHDYANCAWEAGQIEDARSAATQALAFDPGDGLALTLLGRLAEDHDDSQAAHYYQQAVQSSPHLVEPWLALSMLQIRNGEFAIGQETLQRAARAIPDSIPVRLALGESLLAQNNSATALEHLQLAAMLEASLPNHQDGLSIQTAFLLGTALHRLGRDREARQVFEQSIPHPVDTTSLPPDFAAVYAQTLLALQVVDPTRRLFEHSLETQPKNLALLLDYTETLLMDSDQPAAAALALETLEPVIQPNSQSAGAFEAPDYDSLRLQAIVLRAEALRLCGDLEAAGQAYRTALESDLPPALHGRVAFGLGRVSLAAEQFEAAVAALQEAAQLDTQNPAVFRLLSEAYLALNLINEAYTCAETALNLDPDDLAALIWFSDQALRIEESPNAGHLRARPRVIQSLEQASALAPERADLLLKLGELQLLSGDRITAVATFSAVQHADPVTPAELQLAAEYLLHLGDYEKALPLLDLAVQHSGSSGVAKAAPGSQTLTQALVEMAAALQHTGNASLALQTLDQALSLDPHNVELLFAQSSLYAESGDTREALDSLNAALQVQPANPAIHHRYAILCLRTGNQAEALAHADQAVSGLLPDSEPALRLSVRTLAARIAAALIMPTLSRTYLQDALLDPASSDFQGDLPTTLLLPLAHAWLLRADLALELGDQAACALDCSRAESLLPQHPYTAAIQARLALHQLGLVEARKNLSAGWFDALLTEIGALGGDNEQAPDWLLPCLQSLSHTALELGDWQAAESLSSILLEKAPDEAASHWQMARLILLRGEVQHLSAGVEAIKYAPPASTNSQLQDDFVSALDVAQEMIHRLLDNPAVQSLRLHLEQTGITLQRMQLRGAAHFQPGPATVQSFAEALAAGAPTPEETAALVMAYSATWDDQLALKAVRSHPRHPQTLLPAVLVLAHSNTRQALRIARPAAAAQSHPPQLVWPWTAFLQSVLARLAYQAGEKSDDYSLAVKSIQAALQQLPDEPRWQSLAGEIFLDERNLSGHPDPIAALPHLQTAVRLEPDYPLHASLLGKVYTLLGDQSAAVAAYQEVCRLNASDWCAWMDLARAQQAAGSLDAAIYSADRAIERDGSGPAALELRGRLALAAGDPPTAVKCAQAILNQEQANIPAWLLISQAFQQLDRPQDALQALEHAIPISEHPKELLMARAGLIRQTAGIPAAQQAWRQLSERYPGDADVLAGLAEQEVEAGDTTSAVQAGKAALQADLGQLDPARQLQLNLLVGKQLRLAGDPEAAILYLQNALRQEPAKIDAYLELGRSYQDLRRHQQALAAFREAMAIAPKDARPYYHAGIVLKEAKDYQEAETLLRRAAQLAPKDVNIHRQLGAVVALNLIHNRSAMNVAD